MIFESSSYCYILLLLLAGRSIILDMNLARDLDGFWIEELQVCNVEGRTFKSFHFITPCRERALAVERWEQYEWESLPLLPSYSILATLQSELKAFPLDEVQIFTYGWRNKLFLTEALILLNLAPIHVFDLRVYPKREENPLSTDCAERIVERFHRLEAKE